jgi:hypothetical protein
LICDFGIEQEQIFFNLQFVIRNPRLNEFIRAGPICLPLALLKAGVLFVNNVQLALPAYYFAVGAALFN